MIALALALWLGQSAARPVAVTGVVKDQTGAVLPGAEVTMSVGGSATPSERAVTDSAGGFRFERVAAGSYEIRTEFPGFKPQTTPIRVGARAPGPVMIVMQIEGVTQEVSVSGGGPETSTTAANNLDAITVDANTLDDLPVLDQDIVTAMSRFLDATAIGTNGATILVNGVEVNALALSASAVQQIKINQDPYSAEFMRPGRGRIEIITKPGGKEYSGTFNVRFRDADFAARNAFAAVKPPEQRRIFEGTLGGPLGRGGKTDILLSGFYDAQDNQSIVFAQTLAGVVQANVSTPFRNLLAAGVLTHQQGDNNTQSIRFSHLFQRNTNQGVGGTTLPEAGYNHTDREDEATFTQQTVISTKLLHEVKVLFGVEYEPRVSLQPDPHVVVQDSFTGGGAQNDSIRTEHHFTLVDALTWSPRKHTVKFGINIPDWSWRGYNDETNTAGTFYFSTLQDYAAGQPYAFIEQVGNGQVNFLEKVVGLFAQDEIRLRPNLSVDVGLRYDWQNYILNRYNFGPRFSFAYSPDAQGRTVVRGGAGIFYDRTGPGPIQDLLRYDGQHLLRYVLTNPGYPNPLAGGETFGAEPPSVVRLAPDLTIPDSLQYSVSVERQLQPKSTLAMTLSGSRGYDQFLSRDINAPLPPDYLARPDPAFGVIREIESTGVARAINLGVTLRGQVTKYFTGTAQYTEGRSWNNTGGITWMPPNSYDVSQEYGPSDNERRHVVELFGSLTAGRWANIGVSFEGYSGRPYSLITGLDEFNTGTANARPPGVGRNTLRAPGYADLDLRWSHEFPFVPSGQPRAKRTTTFGIDAFNILNRVNDNTPIGNLSSPFFGSPISAQPARRIQFSLRVRY